MQDALRVESFVLNMPEDGSVVIGGDNESGKSSAVHALEMALAGGDASPAAEPIRKGARKAVVIARFGSESGEEYVIEKTWTRVKGGKAKAKLVIRDADGKTQSAAQTLLSSFLNCYALDPVKILRMSDADQLGLAVEIGGRDLNALKKERDAAYIARRDANREVTRLEAALDSAPHNPSVPSEEVSISELTAELQTRQAHNAEGEKLTTAVKDRTRDVEAASTACDNAIDARDSLLMQIAELQAKVESAEEDVAAKMTAVDAAQDARKEAAKAMLAFKAADTDEITGQISKLEDTNRAIRDNARHTEIAEELKAADLVANKRQDELDAIDAKIEEAQASVHERLPIEGLGIGDGCLTYNDVPLSQAGRSAGIRVASAMSMASNKDSRIKLLLIDDGEALSPAHERQILEDAHAEGFQVVMTMVTGRGESHVEIVDGVGALE
jgi:hypothetical protein